MTDGDDRSWLPDLIEFNDHGNWDDYLEAIHEVFLRDFIHSKPSWPGKRMSLKRHPEHGGKSATFWHLISEGPIEDDRLPDLRRSERIAWVRAIIDRFPDRKPETGDPIVWWKTRRGSETRILLALPTFEYLVIMADRGDYLMPWTAFPVAQAHRRHKLRQEYEDFWINRP